jgi:DNA-directed RNA polymerase subunit RPC12/RpoP
MSEFKFACSVCGQHITADSSTSGGQLECPTCFQKIIVPQAPTQADSKFILSASQVSKPRPSQAFSDSDPNRPIGRRTAVPIGGALLLLALCGAGAAVFVFREKLFKSGEGSKSARDSSPKAKGAARSAVVYPIPTNISWTMNITNAILPEANAAGSVNGAGFYCEKATLQGGNLTLRQGRTWPPDIGVSVQLFAHQGEELSGKTVQIGPEQQPPLPKVVLRWKDENEVAVTRNVPAGYALKVVFGEASGGRMPGRLYLSLPDEAKSFVAGSFDAEIRKANPPKPKQPKVPKPGG